MNRLAILLSVPVVCCACTQPLAGTWRPVARAELAPDVAAEGSEVVATVEARLLRVDADLADRWAGPDRGLLRVAHLPELRMHEILEHARENSRSKVYAPRVSVFLGQEARLEVLTQRAYIQDYSTTEDGNLDPLIGVVEEGLRCRLTPSLRGDVQPELGTRQQIRLAGSLELTQLVGLQQVPIDTGDLGSGLSLEVPQLTVSRSPLDLAGQAGVTLLLAPPAAGPEQLLVLLQVRLIVVKEVFSRH